jgi:hypothetical protein
MKRNLIIFMLFLNFLSFAFAAETLRCDWVPQASCTQNDSVLYTHSNVFNNAPNSQPFEFMSSHVANQGNFNYDVALCCTSPLNVVDDRLTFYDSPTTNGLCPNNDQPLFYATNYTNGIIGLNYTSDHNTAFCADLPTTAAYANFELDNTNFYEGRGYQCVFRVSNETNGRISSCNATYGSFNNFQYEYAVWARLIEADSSLRCNSDCTSKLDSRVYASCSSQIPVCNDVPDTCDGSLYSGWVAYPTGPFDIDAYGTHKFQTRCEAPWKQTRVNPEYIEPTEDLGILVESIDGICTSILSQEYSVLVDNIPYKMNVFTCNKE